MLPKQLLRVEIRGRYVRPAHLSPHRYAGLAKALLEAYRWGVGRKYGELEARVREAEERLEVEGYNYKAIKGMIHLLNRRIRVEAEAPVPAADARRTVFMVANELYGGFALNDAERSRVLEEAAGRMGVDPESLWRAYLSVYEENQRVVGFDDVDAVELVKIYNLSLLQTLLFQSLNLSIVFSGSGTETKWLLRRAKYLGLLYTAERVSGRVRLLIDGPASVLKHTERYGTRLAKLIPLVMRFRSWVIEARIAMRGREYLFRLTDRASFLFPRVKEAEETFDSEVESRFAERFARLGLNWRLVREPEPLVVGTHIMIPDFAFIRNGLKVYLEIVGFWTEDYLKRKVEKLSMIREPMIVAVNAELGKVDLEGRPNLAFVYYKRWVDPIAVARLLRRWEPAKGKAGETPGIVELIGRDPEGMTLSQLREELRLRGLEDVNLAEALRKDGYKVKWKGLLGDDAVIVRLE